MSKKEKNPRNNSEIKGIQKQDIKTRKHHKMFLYVHQSQGKVVSRDVTNIELVK